MKLSEKYLWVFWGVISFIMILLWFHSGKLIAGGEEALMFYNPFRSFRLFASPLYENGTGIVIPVYLPRISLLILPVILVSLLHLSNWIGQAFVLFLLIFIGLASIYFLTKEILQKKEFSLIALFTSGFYFCNLYTMSQIFGRLLFTGIMLWSYFPLFLFLYIRLIKTKRIIILFLFLLSSIIFSQTFGMPSNIVTLWVPAVFVTMFYLFKKKNVLLPSLIAVVTWFLVNLWWLYPFIKLSSYSFNMVQGAQTNFNSLLGVSPFFSTSEIVFLRQTFLFNHTYHGFYQQWWVIGLSMIVLIIVCIGIVTSKKLKIWGLLLPLLFIGWFISKGSNPPFGKEFFYLIFSNIPQLQVFRNPYEKFGIVFLFPYAVFFGIGLTNIISWINNYKVKYTVSLIFVLLTIVILVLPLWNGEVFGAGVLNTKIQVPTYYDQSNTFLNKQNSHGRILSLPILPGDGVNYHWKTGTYQGAEPSEFLFDNPVVSRISRAPYADTIYSALYNKFINDEQYNELLEQLNIHYIILHDELNNNASGASSSAQTRLTLAKNSSIVFLKKTGDISLYQYLSKSHLFEVSGIYVPDITYQKISTTKYLISVKNATKPFNLIFKETYNPLWAAKIDNTVIKKHSVIYAYANVWNIEKKGTFKVTITLKVWPWE